jgi:hypothetical protein
MSQLNYNIDQNAAMLGMLVNSEFKHTESMIASEIIPVGRGVTKVVGEDGQIQLPDVTDNDFFGVAHRSQALEGGLPNTTVDPVYPIKSLVNTLRRGSVWVYFETAFDPDSDTLYMRAVAGGAGEEPGQFRNDIDGGDAVAVTGNVVVRTTLAAAGLGAIEINKPL